MPVRPGQGDGTSHLTVFGERALKQLDGVRSEGEALLGDRYSAKACRRTACETMRDSRDIRSAAVTSRLGLRGRARAFLYGVQAALIELHEQRFFLSDGDGSRLLAFGLSDPFAPRIGHLAPAALFKVAVK